MPSMYMCMHSEEYAWMTIRGKGRDLVCFEVCVHTDQWYK